MSENVYGFEAQTIDGQNLSLSAFKGKVLLIVNVASKCGLTPQYQGLQELYKNYSSQGLEILGFPCNQFGAQEPGAEAEIKKFCDLNYKVNFPLFSKIEVNGPGAHPLYKYLKSACPGILGTEDIKWNFTKFLIDQTGSVKDRFAPTTEPKDLVKPIELLLQT